MTVCIGTICEDGKCAVVAADKMVTFGPPMSLQVEPATNTVHNVYEAKKAADVAPGVGKLTDMAIIKDGKVCFMTPDMFKILDEAHKEKPVPSAAEQEKIKGVCDDCTRSGV